MPAALPFPDAIDESSAMTRNYRIIENHYGNGYSQRAPDGFNNVVDSWSIVWNNIDLTTYNTIQNVLNATGGADYLTWTAPGDSVQKKWIVASLSASALSGGIYSVKATLNQVFDL